MKLYGYHIHHILLLFGTLVLLTACSTTRPGEIERGAQHNFTDHSFEEGHPIVRMSAQGYLDEENQPRIDLAADIEQGSLIFREQEGKHRAEVEITVSVIDSGGQGFSNSWSETKSFERENNEFTASSIDNRYEKELEVPPGEYKVYISVIDQASGNETVREVDTFIPDPSEEVVNLTSVQLQGKNSDQPDRGYEPVTTYDVSTRKDSVRFVVQVTNNDSEDPLTVRSRLIEFEADTQAARPAYYPNYSSSSIAYRGIDYRNGEVMEQTEREFDQSGSVMIEFPFERPEEGSYRFEVTVEGAGTEEQEEISNARDFSVMGENFPRIQTPQELAEPLVYLMDENEYEELMTIRDPAEVKEAVDRFWLSNIRSVERARQVIALYYERVEEANRMFTNFKEGWKTDRGMVYILFGPPSRVENRINTEIWRQDVGSADTRYNFVFERPRMRNEYLPFDNYLLQRHQGYFNYQYQQTQLWLNGQILDGFM